MKYEPFINYIGMLKNNSDEFGKVSGNGFFISPDTIVTAKHVIEELPEDECAFFYQGKEFKVNPSNVDTIDEYDLAVVRFDTDIVDFFEEQYAFNTKETFEDESLFWEMMGYFSHGNYGEKKYLSGRSISGYDRDCLVCSNFNQPVVELRSMSGSPVIINQMIIGVFIEQAKAYATISHIIIVPISAIAGNISESLKRNNIFNHKEIPKIDYADKFKDTFQIENYIERRCRHYGCTDYYSLLTRRLYDYADGEQFNGKIVLTGEGGLGKTYELKNLAVQLYGCDEVHPFYYSLGDYHSGITSFKDISETVKVYRENHVPCCLLLDGFDEIINPIDIDRFRRMINNENYNNNDYSVIISSRKTDFQSGMFRGFTELELCPLRKNDVQRIVREHGINAGDFYAEVEKNHLERVVEFPFYLNELIAIFSEEGHLPERAKLFEKMIDSMLAKCFRKHGNLGEGLGASGNYSAKNNLARIAMTMNYMGGNKVEEAAFNDIVNKVCDPVQSQVLDKCGLIGRNADGDRYFVHKNFFEFLVAKYLNEQHRDNLEGLLSVITDGGSEILPEYKHIVPYIVDIRENTDLMEWLLANQPKAAEYFESDKFDNAKLLHGFGMLFEEYTDKGLYSEVDGSSDLEKWARTVNCADYLLEKSESASQENELVNALHLLRITAIPTELYLRTFEILYALLDSQPSAIVVIRMIRLVSEHQLDDGFCDRLMAEFKDTSDDIIIQNLCEYLTAIQRADDYVQFVVDAIEKCADHNMISYDIVDCVASFQKAESIKAFLSYVENSLKNGRLVSCLDKLFSDDLYQNLAGQFKNHHLYDKDRKTIAGIVFAVSDRWRKDDLDKWCRLFTEINAESETLEDFFALCSPRGRQFVNLTFNYSGFSDFVKEKTENGEFDSQQDYLISIMMHISNEHPKRAELMEYMQKSEKESAKAVVRFFSEPEQGDIPDKRLLELKYIFDTNKLIAALNDIVSQSGKEDLTYNEFIRIAYHSVSQSSALTVFQLFDSYCVNKESLKNSMENFSGCEETKRKFFIESVCQFVSSNQDYQELMTDSQKERVVRFCLDFVQQTDFEKLVSYTTLCYIDMDIQILESVIQVIMMMDISIEKDKCLEILYLPLDGLLRKSAGEILKYFNNHLSYDEMVSRFKMYIDKDMVQGYFAEILFKYAAELKTLDETIRSFAVTTLCNNEKRFYHRPVWEYLSAINHLDSIVSCIAAGQINPGTVVKHIEDLYSYSELFDYFSALFDKLESHKEKIEEDESNKEILKKEYPFIFDSIRSEEVVYISKELDYYLQMIFKYLVHQQSKSHIESYLKEMLDKHSKSHLDYDEYRTNLNDISSVSHLDSLIRIFEMLSEGSYIPETKFHTLNSDINQALDNIAKEHLDLVLQRISALADSENMDVKRAANNYLFKWEERKHYSERPALNVYEAAEKVATETNFYPFY